MHSHQGDPNDSSYEHDHHGRFTSEFLTTGDAALAEEFLSPEIVLHFAGQQQRGRDTYLAVVVAANADTFEDLVWTVEDGRRRRCRGGARHDDRDARGRLRRVPPTTATLLKADVGPHADRAWAVDGGLWICDGQRLHRYDTTTLQPVAAIDLGIDCDPPGGTTDLIVASSYDRDDGESRMSAAGVHRSRIQPAPRHRRPPRRRQHRHPAQRHRVFPAEGGTRAVVVDRDTWSVVATPDLGRTTGDLGTIETEGTSIYIPTLDQRDVPVIDTTTFTVTNTIEPLGVHSVTLLDQSLWVSSYDFTLQRFDLPP